MVDSTDSHGIVEEPSAKAQEDALKAAEETVEVFPEDEIAKCETAEQGSVAEPSAKAQEEMLKENS